MFFFPCTESLPFMSLLYDVLVGTIPRSPGDDFAVNRLQKPIFSSFKYICTLPGLGDQVFGGEVVESHLLPCRPPRCKTKVKMW